MTGSGVEVWSNSSIFCLRKRKSEPTVKFVESASPQVTAEVYYRFQLLKILTITPDLQLVFNPAENPDENMIAVFGIRARISF